VAQNPFEQNPDVAGRAKVILGRLGGWTGWLIVLIVIGFYAAGGVYTVGPSEVGLVKRFGKHVDTTGPGVHYHWPAPIESVIIVPVTEIQKVEIGFRTISPPPNPQYRGVDAEALMLTGKEKTRNAKGEAITNGQITVGNNIVWVECVVQYQIKDPAQFTFNIIDPPALVQMAAESVLREEVAKRTLDEVLTTERDAIAQDVREKLQALLDTYKAGVFVVNVKLQDTLPPKPVAAAFDDVNSARQDRETKIEEANRHRNQVVPEAEGEAQQIINAAEGYQEQKIAAANGEVSRFAQVLKQFESGDRSVTMSRLYIEMMEQVLPNLNVLILPENVGGNGTLKLLDLSTLLKTQPIQAQSNQSKEKQP